LKSFLALESGQVFEGCWKGSKKNDRGVGEVVFNTGMVGYQEILTDPSYYQQIIVMTAPEQGNYGTLEKERESAQVWVQGLVCLEAYNHAPPGRKPLLQELEEFGVPMMSGVDTRSLTLELRSRGTVWGSFVETEDPERALAAAREKIRKCQDRLERDWVREVSVKERKLISGKASRGRVAIIDYGAKLNIIRNLAERTKELAIFPSRALPREILSWNPDGIMLTNGPGDPADVKQAVETVRELLGQRPIFGICMGNQILGLALGAKTYKLKFGHRGINHPVQDLYTKEIYMTSQNHGYCVDEKTLPSEARLSQINLYDKTCEGIECIPKNAWSVQYHPEAAPGPHDAGGLFDRFIDGLNLT